MSNFDWVFGISFNGIQYEYRWDETFYGEDSMGYYGTIVNPNTGQKITESLLPDDEWLINAITKATSSFRQSELRQDISKKYPLSITNMDSSIHTTILELFERSQSGEYLGQLSNNQLFYVQDLASLFDMPMKYILEKVDALVKTGKIGLYGMILIPYERYAENLKNMEQKTGHKKISISDFGWWSCTACGQNGDDYTNPKDYECNTLFDQITR